ncbi:MAG: hypothetical protein E7480_05925 [Ruminococcaceae bacterium]|nr:hypothetical protein [Oscillospiraceae bacterium]
MKIKIFLLFFLPALCLCGCYDYSEAETLSIISCAAVDYNGYQVELFVFASDFADSNENDNEKISMSSVGENMETAVKNMENEYGTHLYWSHCDAIVIGKELAEIGIYPVLDFILNTPDARITTNLLVAKKAREALEAKDDFGKSIIKVINFNKKLNSCPSYTVYKKSALKEEYLLPMLFLSDKGAGFEIHRCAKFLSDRFQEVSRY